MARASRGASRSWDAPLVCNPAPAPTLQLISFDQIAVDTYDLGFPAEDETTIDIYKDGVLLLSDTTTWFVLGGDGYIFEFEAGHSYRVRILIPALLGYCAGWTDLSNSIDT